MWKQVSLKDPHSVWFWQFGQKYTHEYPARGHYVGFLQSPSWSSSHKEADTSPPAVLMPFYSLVQFSLCSGPSSGNTSTLLRLCWGREQIFMWWQVWMCHPGGAGLCVHHECAAGTVSCIQQWEGHYRKIIQVGYRESRGGLWKLFLFGSCLIVDFPSVPVVTFLERVLNLAPYVFTACVMCRACHKNWLAGRCSCLCCVMCA